jgi:hypothetical protein
LIFPAAAVAVGGLTDLAAEFRDVLATFGFISSKVRRAQ